MQDVHGAGVCDDDVLKDVGVCPRVDDEDFVHVDEGRLVADLRYMDACRHARHTVI